MGRQDFLPFAFGGSRGFALALPFKGRVGWGWCWFAFRLLRFRENRLTSVCVSSAIHGRRLLSFACPKESNQRKGHPRGRGHAGIPARVTTRAGCGLRREHIPVLSSKWPASCRPPLRGFSSACSPRPRGAREEQSAAVPAAEAPHICDIPPRRHSGESRNPSCSCSRPSKPRRRADGSAACTARGRREGSRRFGCRPWMACQPNPSARSEPSPQARARRRGCCSLWLLSLAQARESNWSPWMATKPHTDVSRSSRQRRNRNEQSQNGFRPSPE